MKKRGRMAVPLCSQGAHDRNVHARCAQLGHDHPPPLGRRPGGKGKIKEKEDPYARGARTLGRCSPHTRSDGQPQPFPAASSVKAGKNING
jgi:hypothetical protein